MVTNRSSPGISRIKALVHVVLPEPVGPDTRMFFRLRTAKRMKASYSAAASRRCSSSSVSSSFLPACLVFEKIPRRLNSSMLHTWSAGRRIAMATQPAVVAGGMTICTRSPLGNEADNSGAVASMRCCVELATNLANRVHHSKSANGSGSLRQPSRVSRNACSGRLMQSSVTSAFASSGRRARRLRLSAETSSPALTIGGGLQFIDRSEIQIARDQHLDTVALLFDHRRRNIDGSLEDFGHHTLRRR